MTPMTEVSDTLPPVLGAPPKIRPARLLDWPRLLPLVEKVYPQVPKAQLAHWLREERHSLAVAIDAHGLAGFVRLRVMPGERRTAVDCLGVDPRARDSGVGSALLDYAAQVACACAAPVLVGEVQADEGAALAFCRRRGFLPGVTLTGEDGRRRVVLTRRVSPPLWPLWDLRRAHAPRVPPDLLDRCATWALFGAWLGPDAQTGFSSSGSPNRVV
ncbi:MAG: GNAT family N-acetyltransferase [Burkholderiales bacterium]|jgi:GNAT superfamily N-acetyltransferase|nr:GNAT family N-acetyltransferase [Burkholderiales bacterium]MBP7520722.1 GNAT family N-acetyltransferase [Leptothrix sp. (in: b-proteobacteria)]